MVSSVRRDDNEEQVLQRLHRFLDTQNDTLDDSDLTLLRDFLDRRGSRLQADWNRVAAAVQRQSSENSIASSVLDLLSQLRISLEERVVEFKKERPLEYPLVIFVGAGGSAPLPTAIPTVKNLLPILWSKAEEIGNKPLLRIREQCESLGIVNIEDLLSAIYLAQGAVGNVKITGLLRLLLAGEDSEHREGRAFLRRRSLSPRQESPALGSGIEVVESLRESLQTLFSVLVGMMVGKECNAIHRALARNCEDSDDTTLVTTNYDVCIEAALGEGKYAYGIESVLQPLDVVPRSHATHILKLHGSLNWYVCLSCDRYIAAAVSSIDRAFGEGLYPVIAMCKTCQATAQQLIVPPIAQKYQAHPFLLQVRQAAEQALREAKSIVVVGYSFTESDEYILRMTSRAVEGQPNKDIVVLDTDPAPANRLKQFLAAHARNYDHSSRFFSFIGDAAMSLPVLLENAAPVSPDGKKPESRPKRSRTSAKLAQVQTASN